MGGIVLFAIYALALLANVYLLARLTDDEDALPFFLIPILSGPIMLAGVMAFIAASAVYRLGLRHGRR